MRAKPWARQLLLFGLARRFALWGRLGGHRLRGGNSLTHQPPRIGSRESARCVLDGLAGAEQGASSKGLPMSCRPSGVPSLDSPAGTEMPGNPAMFAVTVKMSFEVHLRSDRRTFADAEAGPGVVGVSSTSTLLNASSKSRLISVRTFCALSNRRRNSRRRARRCRSGRGGAPPRQSPPRAWSRRCR